MLKIINELLINHFYFLGKIKRFFIALIDFILPLKNSYSQYKEDSFLKNYLGNFDKGDVYVDIGCNHPTLINNTYLFYRMGFKGICIDANYEFKYLYKIFRRNDVFLNLGVGDYCTLKYFNISKTPVLSSFNFTNLRVAKRVLVPIFTLDKIMENFDYSMIFLLSIDVEGFSINVLRGASEALKKVFLILIEFDNKEEKDEIINYLRQKDFLLVEEFNCNLLFKNLSLM